MEFNHKPVLLDECLDALKIKADGIYIDGTLGGAGHSSEIYRRLSDKGTLIGLDQDSVALQTAGERLKALDLNARLILENTNFKNMDKVCKDYGIESVDGILMDIGVSSYQLDTGERGFSYQKDAPLDMRMDRSLTLDASEIVNTYSENDIKRVIRDYGEENWAARIAEFIIKARKEKRIETTFELVDIIKAAIPSKARRDGPHPAKRTFQALRIEVNNELGVLEDAIDSSLKVLGNGGRLCIITFHSLEDRIVKTKFQKMQNPCTCPSSFPVCVCKKIKEGQVVTRKPILPSDEEILENPRARSAKLRVFEKATN